MGDERISEIINAGLTPVDQIPDGKLEEWSAFTFEEDGVMYAVLSSVLDESKEPVDLHNPEHAKRGQDWLKQTRESAENQKAKRRATIRPPVRYRARY